MTSGNLDSLPHVSSTSIDAQKRPLATTTSSSIPHPHSTSEAKESQRPQSSGQTEKATTKNSQVRTTSGNLDSLSPMSSTSTDTQNNQIRTTSIKHDSLSPVSSTLTDTPCLRANTTNSKNQQPQSSRPIERATTKNNQIRTTYGKHDSLSPVSSTSTDNKRRPPSKMTSGESSDKKKRQIWITTMTSVHYVVRLPLQLTTRDGDHMYVSLEAKTVVEATTSYGDMAAMKMSRREKGEEGKSGEMMSRLK